MPLEACRLVGSGASGHPVLTCRQHSPVSQPHLVPTRRSVVQVVLAIAGTATRPSREPAWTCSAHTPPASTAGCPVNAGLPRAGSFYIVLWCGHVAWRAPAPADSQYQLGVEKFIPRLWGSGPHFRQQPESLATRTLNNLQGFPPTPSEVCQNGSQCQANTSPAEWRGAGCGTHRAAVTSPGVTQHLHVFTPHPIVRSFYRASMIE